MKPWQKLYPLSDKNAFICLVDHMGDDSSIVQAARVSYGNDLQDEDYCGTIEHKLPIKDRNLIRYLMNHQHTTPFEMVTIKFMVQIPMDHWRQWIRHRTANVNEYSTRYTEALDFFQVTQPTEWRLQATDNKQGSSGYLEGWPSKFVTDEDQIETGFETIADATDPMQHGSPGKYLTAKEANFHAHAVDLYQERLALGIAKEQARKDLPLSTYTRAYWKCDLHNIFNFLRLRMHSHAQKEIRSFANCMFEIVKQICPVACEAFEDYVLHSKRFSRMEMEVLRRFLRSEQVTYTNFHKHKSSSMTYREWKEFLEKIQ